jgi:pseudouridine kinase
MGISELSLTGREEPALVIGAAGVDFIGRLKGKLSLQTSNPAFIHTAYGGVARNVAENLAHLGQPVTLLTAVGEDEAGDQLVQQAEEAGIDVHAVVRTPGQPTSSYIGVLNASGERVFALDDMRSIVALTPHCIHEHASLFDTACLVFVDANLSRETLRSVVSLARKAGLPVCADPTSSSLAPRLKKLLPYLCLITPSATEAGILSGHPFEATDRHQASQAAKSLVAQGVEIVLVTLAEFGVAYATTETSGSVPAIRADVNDPTGAGDALTAAVLFALLNDIPLDDAVRLGTAAASLTLCHVGAVAPDLTLQKLYDHLLL